MLPFGRNKNLPAGFDYNFSIYASLSIFHHSSFSLDSKSMNEFGQFYWNR